MSNELQMHRLVTAENYHLKCVLKEIFSCDDMLQSDLGQMW